MGYDRDDYIHRSLYENITGVEDLSYVSSGDCKEKVDRYKITRAGKKYEVLDGVRVLNCFFSFEEAVKEIERLRDAT